MKKLTKKADQDKKYLQALKESEARFRSIVLWSPDAIIVTDAKGKIEYMNPAAEVVFNRKMESFIGKDFGLPLVNGESTEIDIFRPGKDPGVGDMYVVEAQWLGENTHLITIRDITMRKQIEEKIKQAQEALFIINNKLEERNRQNSLLSEMRELLQSCSTVQEVPAIVISYAAKLFPGTDGALFLLSDSKSDLQSMARWGYFPEDVDSNIFAPDACWGLRQGRVYAVEDMKTGPICPHLKKSSSTTYICLPLIGKGEIIGLLHLGTKRPVQEDDKQANIFELKEIAVMFAEYFSLSIANIKLSEKLTSQSVRDPLTRLYNRRYMDEIIQHEILRAARQQTGIGVVMIDIDHFKQINDTYGHEAGDEFLTRLADFFRLQIRRSDFIFRYGGEEFVLVLPESSVEDTYKYAESLRKEIKNMKINFRDQQLPSITLSFGISAYPDLGLDTIELIRIADKALNKAKEAGRDRVVIGAQDTAVDITERKHAKEELQGSLNSLSKEFNTIVQVLISSIEMKDPYTASHQRWSANIACAIATEMGLPQDKIDGLRMAGSMHDIGKLSIPAEILSKPTKLTEIEFSLIKEHSRSGYEMLKDVESPWPLAQIVYQHHERMNGSGYPRNLKGDEILMESRILAVADIVEAMASYRPYRAALGIEAALEEIEKNKGVFYDDAVADACLRLFREKGYQLKYDGETNPVEKT